MICDMDSYLHLNPERLPPVPNSEREAELFAPPPDMGVSITRVLPSQYTGAFTRLFMEIPHVVLPTISVATITYRNHNYLDTTCGSIYHTSNLFVGV